MTITITPEVKRLLRAAGFTDAEIATKEVRANEAHNLLMQPTNPLEEDVKLPERFSVNALDFMLPSTDH